MDRHSTARKRKNPNPINIKIEFLQPSDTENDRCQMTLPEREVKVEQLSQQAAAQIEAKPDVSLKEFLMPNGKYRDEYRTDVKPSSPKLEYRTTVTPTESRRMGATVVPMVTRKMGAIVLPAKRRKVEPKKVVVEREPASESNTLTPNELLLSLFNLESTVASTTKPVESPLRSSNDDDPQESVSELDSVDFEGAFMPAALHVDPVPSVSCTAEVSVSPTGLLDALLPDLSSPMTTVPKPMPRVYQLAALKAKMALLKQANHSPPKKATLNPPENEDEIPRTELGYPAFRFAAGPNMIGLRKPRKVDAKPDEDQPLEKLNPGLAQALAGMKTVDRVVHAVETSTTTIEMDPPMTPVPKTLADIFGQPSPPIQRVIRLPTNGQEINMRTGPILNPVPSLTLMPRFVSSPMINKRSNGWTPRNAKGAFPRLMSPKPTETQTTADIRLTANINNNESPKMPSTIEGDNAADEVRCHLCDFPMKICVRKTKYKDEIREYPAYRCLRKGCQTFRAVRKVLNPALVTKRKTKTPLRVAASESPELEEEFIIIPADECKDEMQLIDEAHKESTVAV